ncbi:MAG: 3-oxoacyl-ACP reductase FabG [Sphaerochaetaceae bacterium]|nr:3-oxoacyl-ACP reductase FabG [Sphaerochaetaceae bacterium]
MLKGKCSIVTGGSRGIGEAICYKLASLGSDIAIVYAGNHEKANQVALKCVQQYQVKAKTYCCDVACFSAVKACIALIKEDFAGVQILVNNAGITKDKLMLMMDEEDYDSVLDVNLKGAFNMIRHTLPIFVRAREGVIVNISSVSGLMGNSGQANYSSSKAGLIGLTKTVAKEYASRGIRCNAVAPGFIATDMTQTQEENPLLNAIPLKRMGCCEDVAEAVSYLVNASYVTGTVLRVDGGISM